MSGSDDGEIGRSQVYMGIIITLCLIAVLLNLVVIAAVIKIGRCRASIDIFITNVATSDILHAGIVTPMHFRNAAVHHKDFYGGNSICKLMMFLPLFSVMGGILTIVAIAIDRYRVIVLQKTLDRRGAIRIVVLIWLLSILVSAPQIYEYNIYDDKEEHNPNITYKSCGSEGIIEHFETIYASLVFVFAYMVPLIILSSSYTRLVLYVWRHGKRFRKVQSSNVSDQNGPINENQKAVELKKNKMLTERMVKLLKMLIWITATFVVLWTPYFILFGMTEIMGMDDTSKLSEWPHAIGRTMTVLSTVTNPVLYLVFSEPFRNAFCNTFRDRTLRSNIQPSSINAKSKTTRPKSNKVRPTISAPGLMDNPGCSNVDTEIFSLPLKSYAEKDENQKSETHT